MKKFFVVAALAPSIVNSCMATTVRIQNTVGIDLQIIVGSEYCIAPANRTVEMEIAAQSLRVVVPKDHANYYVILQPSVAINGDHCAFTISEVGGRDRAITTIPGFPPFRLPVGAIMHRYLEITKQ